MVKGRALERQRSAAELSARFLLVGETAGSVPKPHALMSLFTSGAWGLRPVLAVAFYGMLPRFQNSRCSRHGHRCRPIEQSCTELRTSIETLSQVVLPSLLDRALRPSLAGGFMEVQVYGHTYLSMNRSTCMEDLERILSETLHRWSLQERYLHIRAVSVTSSENLVAKNPILSDVKELVSSNETLARYLEPFARLNSLLSINACLALLPPLPSDELFVLLVRWDIIFFVDANFAILNQALFYRANWCSAQIPQVAAAHNRVTTHSHLCHSLTTFHGAYGCPFEGDASTTSAPGVPDYFFFANVSAMRMTWTSLLEELVSGKYHPEPCTPLHGLIGGRLNFLSRMRGLLLGRFLYQNFDFSFARSPFWDPVSRAWLVKGKGSNASEPQHSVHPSEVAARAVLGRWAPNAQRLGVNGFRIWLEQNDSGPMQHTYEVDKPMLPSVCRGGPRFCGCPLPTDPRRSIAARTTLANYCPAISN